MNKHIGMRIKSMDNLIKRKMYQLKGKKNMTDYSLMNHWIIGYMHQNQDKDIFQRDLEEAFSINRATVSKMLKLMEQKGMIRRDDVAFDQRLKKIILLPAALDMYAAYEEAHTVLAKIVEKDLTPSEIQVFNRVCDKIMDNLS